MATDEDIVRLKRALDANVAALENTAEFIRADVAFHYELDMITQNPIFAAVYDILAEWLIDQRAMTIYMPDADRFSVRDHASIYEAVAAHDPKRAFHEMGYLRLISQLYHESKRLSEKILRDIARNVAERMDREKQNMWSGSLIGAASRNQNARGTIDTFPLPRASLLRQRSGPGGNWCDACMHRKGVCPCQVRRRSTGPWTEDCMVSHLNPPGCRRR